MEKPGARLKLRTSVSQVDFPFFFIAGFSSSIAGAHRRVDTPFGTPNPPHGASQPDGLLLTLSLGERLWMFGGAGGFAEEQQHLKLASRAG